MVLASWSMAVSIWTVEVAKSSFLFSTVRSDWKETVTFSLISSSELFWISCRDFLVDLDYQHNRDENRNSTKMTWGTYRFCREQTCRFLFSSSGNNSFVFAATFFVILGRGFSSHGCRPSFLECKCTNTRFTFLVCHFDIIVCGFSCFSFGSDLSTRRKSWNLKTSPPSSAFQKGLPVHCCLIPLIGFLMTDWTKCIQSQTKKGIMHPS